MHPEETVRTDEHTAEGAGTERVTTVPEQRDDEEYEPTIVRGRE